PPGQAKRCPRRGAHVCPTAVRREGLRVEPALSRFHVLAGRSGGGRSTPRLSSGGASQRTATRQSSQSEPTTRALLRVNLSRHSLTQPQPTLSWRPRHALQNPVAERHPSDREPEHHL